MHLKSITLKGFKSFPDRTRLEFGPGVSVVVGPNGSGKSNVTDAVLWAMGEQSPLAVRGQSMQDVIFGGGRGVQARSRAEVEIVLDNADGALELPLSEISISRSLDRAGEGEYRVNGARCRLVDVIEVLSDTGLGKEMHSVISQGRVESIVTSKPRDRRLLIEEAAGLGKHRKRRRRAQLKLDRTQDNLDRALDVEREARSRLRPLKRQAEAAELHERLERQTLEVRLELQRDTLRSREAEGRDLQARAAEARSQRAEIEAALAVVGRRRQEAERTLARRAEQRDQLSRRAYAARSALERCQLRLEQARRLADELDERCARRDVELAALRAEPDADQAERRSPRLVELESELAELERLRETELETELLDLRAQSEERGRAAAEATAEVTRLTSATDSSTSAAEESRRLLREAEANLEAARRSAASVGAELAGLNQFLRAHAAGGQEGALSTQLVVQEGCEAALTAVLGGSLGAAVVDDLPAAMEILERSGEDGGHALISSPPAHTPRRERAPSSGARRLIEVVTGPAPARELAARLLADAWLVDSLDDLDPGFEGVAVTPQGRAWFAAMGELRQAASGGEERALAQRNRRERLIAESERAASLVVRAERELERRAGEMAAAERALESVQLALRDGRRRQAESLEEQRRLEWLVEQRRAAPEHGPSAVRRAELVGELAAERRGEQRAAAEHARRAARRDVLQRSNEADRLLVPRATRLGEAIAAAIEGLDHHARRFGAELEADREAGEQVAATLRVCATEEAEIQARLRAQGELVTESEVRAQRARDQAAEARDELETIAGRLGLAAEPASDALDDLRREELEARRDRLERRREQLGPVNPLAQEEYAQAVEHVEELEVHRGDLETALRELAALIRDTDRQIRETFEQTFTAAARNFEQLAGEVFPGGRGRLRLVREDMGPRPVLGGEEHAEGAATEDPAPGDRDASADEPPSPDELLGVEIEITPAGKSMKRLSLLSGGEKSMTAIAFLFAVFLARPCPFYILDEVEAALDDLNIGRFLGLLRRHSNRAQFIVVTHQKRTMEAADCLYGVSMGEDGVSRVVSRRLARGLASELEGVERAAEPRASAGAA